MQIVQKKHLETHKTKQINCRIIWQETVRKLIDGLERLGYCVLKKSRKADFIKFLAPFCTEICHPVHALIMMLHTYSQTNFLWPYYLCMKVKWRSDFCCLLCTIDFLGCEHEGFKLELTLFSCNGYLVFNFIVESAEFQYT